jgi:hypothetical protein
LTTKVKGDEQIYFCVRSSLYFVEWNSMPNRRLNKE